MKTDVTFGVPKAQVEVEPRSFVLESTVTYLHMYNRYTYIETAPTELI